MKNLKNFFPRDLSLRVLFVFCVALCVALVILAVVALFDASQRARAADNPEVQHTKMQACASNAVADTILDLAIRGHIPPGAARGIIAEVEKKKCVECSTDSITETVAELLAFGYIPTHASLAILFEAEERCGI